MSGIEKSVFYAGGDLDMRPGWYFKVWRDLGGGYTVGAKGGPFETEDKAKLECSWVRNQWETYES